jgi:hypothetical protein
MNLELQIRIVGDDLVVRLRGNDDQGGYTVSEDSIPLAEIKSALDRISETRQG